MKFASYATLVSVLAMALAACSDATFNDAPNTKVDPEPVAQEEPAPLPPPVEEPIAQIEALPVEQRLESNELVARVNEAQAINKEYASQIPGVSTVKVGVNFEDTAVGSDLDYNDAVLCFQGYFKVDKFNVVSALNQTVVATTSSISGCSHTVEVLVVHADGTAAAPIVYNSRMMGPLNLTFKTGDRLDVSLTAIDGCDMGVKRNMADPNFAKIQIGLCNTTGR